MDVGTATDAGGWKLGGGSVVVGSLFNFNPIVYGVLCFVFVCYALLCVFSSFAIILLRKRELVTLLIGPDKDIL